MEREGEHLQWADARSSRPLTMDRPAALNALTHDMVRGDEALPAWEQNAAVGAVIVQSSSKHFVGGDVAQVCKDGLAEYSGEGAQKGSRCRWDSSATSTT